MFLNSNRTPVLKFGSLFCSETTPAKQELKVCVEYEDEDKFKESNLAILETSLPSGYTANKNIFKAIRENRSVKVSSRGNDFGKYLFQYFLLDWWRPKMKTQWWSFTLTICPKTTPSAFPSLPIEPIRWTIRDHPQLSSTITLLVRPLNNKINQVNNYGTIFEFDYQLEIMPL